MKNISTLPKEYKFTKYTDTIDGGIRYDLHYKGENVAYALVFPKLSERRKEAQAHEKPGFQLIDGPWLEGVFVNEEHQHKGLGIYLINKIERDHTGETIRLKAEPYKSKNLSIKRLMKYYGHLGYKSYDENRMFKKIKRA